MLKKLIAITLVTIIAVTAITANSYAAIAQKANTIVLDLGPSTKDDLKDLQYAEGKLFKRIANAVKNLKDAGEVDEQAQPVIIVVEQKRERDF